MLSRGFAIACPLSLKGWVMYIDEMNVTLDKATLVINRLPYPLAPSLLREGEPIK